jgi:hypothetical protein
MACELGPIHHWIFEQARRAEARGERLAAALILGGHPGAAAAWAAAWAQHPLELRRRPLAAFIGEGAVHEGLEGLVAQVCAREGALYRLALSAGPDALAALAGALRADGRAIGEAARVGGESCDARIRFASLREHWLEGMPCHVAIEVDVDLPYEVAWRRHGQPLAAYWGLPAEAAAGLAALHVEWMAAFVAAGGGHRLEARPWSGGGEGSLALRILPSA